LTRKQCFQVEGERKAVFEDCESEKAANKEKIKKLKAEVKKLQVTKRLVEVKQLQVTKPFFISQTISSNITSDKS
jgi:hypothetical protein